MRAGAREMRKRFWGGSSKALRDGGARQKEKCLASGLEPVAPASTEGRSRDWVAQNEAGARMATPRTVAVGARAREFGQRHQCSTRSEPALGPSRRDDDACGRGSCAGCPPRARRERLSFLLAATGETAEAAAPNAAASRQRPQSYGLRYTQLPAPEVACPTRAPLLELPAQTLRGRREGSEFSRVPFLGRTLAALGNPQPLRCPQL